MTLGQWNDVYKSYRELYNFETKKMLYKDIEDEAVINKAKHQPETSILDL